MKESRVSIGAIFIGALIALLLNFAMTLAGAGIGLGSLGMNIEEMPSTGILIGIAILAIIGASVVFYIGGYIAARLAPTRGDRWVAAIHGLGSFALCTLIMVYIVGASASSVARDFASKAGIGASATLGSPALAMIADKISKMRIVTDMSILEGKAVTQFVVPGTNQAKTLDRTIAQVKKQTEKIADNPTVQEAGKEVASVVGKGVLLMSLLGLSLLIAGGIASVRGSFKGNRATT